MGSEAARAQLPAFCFDAMKHKSGGECGYEHVLYAFVWGAIETAWLLFLVMTPYMTNQSSIC